MAETKNIEALEPQSALSEELAEPQAALSEELAEPQSALNEEAAEPQSAEKEAGDADPQAMSNEEFDEYIRKLKDGYVRDENSETETETEGKAEAEPETTEETKPEPTEEEEKKFTQADVNRIISKRLSENRADTDRLAAIGNEAMRFYGGNDPTEAVERMLNDLKRQNAEAMGVNETEYAQRNDMERKARAYDEQQAQIKSREDNARQIQERWKRESAELKELVPEFDFMAAMNTNPDFKEAVLNGKSIAAAYMSAQRKEPAKKRADIKQNAASKRGASGKTEFNPYTASDKEFNDYIKRIKNGV